MTHIQTPADQKLALALAESDARLDQEDREIARAKQDEIDLVLVDIEAIAKRIDEAVDDDGDDYHIDATITVVADSPRAIEDHFGSDATVTAGGSFDEDPPAEPGVEIEQLQDAFDTYVLPQLAKASPAVRKKFLAWVAKT
jgi:hypothetical protein